MLRSRFDAAVRWRARQEIYRHVNLHESLHHTTGAAGDESSSAIPTMDFFANQSPDQLWELFSGHVPGRPSFGPGTMIQNDFFQIETPELIASFGESPRFHGKHWQRASILRLAKMRMSSHLEPQERLRAVGFGVGTEPIPAVLAKWGYRVLASDYFDGPNKDAWTSTNEMLEIPDKQRLNDRNICEPTTFNQNVDLQNINMNMLPKELIQSADFVWSTCALGHIGGYQEGLDFILESAKCLKPGGVAIHTTEVVAQDVDYLDTPDLSLYRIRDLENVLERLRHQGYEVPVHYFKSGSGMLDRQVSREPDRPDPHITIEIFGRNVYNVSLVFERARA
jgi:hypothetical protein